MKIFYVDDDDDDREMLAAAFVAADPRTDFTAFESCDDILACLQAGPAPDFIFIDINMPKMNGYECAKEIRSNAKLKDVQVVMYSTAFNPLDLEKYKHLNASFLAKESSFSRLVEMLTKMLRQKQIILEE